MEQTNIAEPRTRKARVPSQPATPAKTKKDQLIDLLRAKGGSAVQALSDTLGWQPHTVRAALTGLRKAGIVVEKMPVREGEPIRYRINAKRSRLAQ
jgi:predicted ArsR family transcriptional regulator